MTPPPAATTTGCARTSRAALRDAFLIGLAIGGWIGYTIGRTDSEAPPEK